MLQRTLLLKPSRRRWELETPRRDGLEDTHMHTPLQLDELHLFVPLPAVSACRVQDLKSIFSGVLTCIHGKYCAEPLGL